MKTEYAVWQDEIARPKRTIAQRVAHWFDRPRDAAAPENEPEIDHFRWWSVAELMERRP